MTFDLIILGGGLSGAWTLKEILDQAGPERRKLSIAVVDRLGRSFGGLPYGPQSGQNYLLMNPDEELAQTPYLDWCRANGYFASRASRRQFGRFLDETLRDAIAGTRHQVTQVTGEVVGFQKVDGGFELRCCDGAIIRGRVVVLALGSSSARRVGRLVDTESYVEEMYRTDWAEIEARILARFGEDRAQNVLVTLGTNAAGAEVVHSVANSPAIMARLGRIVAISRHGEFPDGGRSGLVAYQSRFLQDGAICDADGLMAALSADVAAARQAGHTTLDAVLDTRADFTARFVALDQSEKTRFATVHAREYKLVTRRSPPEYDAAVRDLQAAGMLETRAGEVDLARVVIADGVVRVPVAGGEIAGRVLVNCLGAVGLAASDDPLILRLVSLYGVNASGDGFAVDRRFALDRNLFVLGPMLAGYSQPDDSIWHLESIPRIVNYARRLAGDILSDLAEF